MTTGGTATGGTTTESGGAPPSGGSSGESTGGATNGGQGGSSGAVGSGGTAPGTGGGPTIEPSGDCTFDVTHSLSDVIGTVGIVEFSVDWSTLDEASIEFGRSTNYGMTAPVDLEEPNFRTLLLGMKTDSEYHFRVKATSGGEECTSRDFSLSIAAAPTEIVEPEITTPLPEQRSEGFLLTSRWGNNNGGPAFILDANRDLVWWYFAPIDVMRFRMSYDGKWMWIRNTAQMDGSGAVMRVSLDGMTEDLWELPRTTHDMAVLPDGKVGLITHTDGCDEIIELDPETGTTSSIFNLEDAHGSTDCHGNYLAYSELDDSYYISDFFVDSYIKISRAGELQWVLNGEASTISGSDWTGGQHGIHVLSPDHLVIFNNGAMSGSSLILEYELDLEDGTASQIWSYDAGVRAGFGGDVQRLENGNTLISYSSISRIQEVNPAGDLVQEIRYPMDHTVSYVINRPTLYGGTPPKVDGL